MASALCLIFFASGAAALVFEVLWFRQASLAFGSSVWASSLVLSSFMAGLALGSGLVARLGQRIRRPVHLYAWLEAAIALTGAGLVWLLPLLAGVLAPLFRPFLEQPWLLNALRLVLGFGLLLVPATAMGATLPVLVKALRPGERDLGPALGRLYGWNTLGAVAGAVGSEVFLIEAFGIRGSALAAGLLDLACAAAALALARGVGARTLAPAAIPAPAAPQSRRAVLLLGASFLAGWTLLALEVVWFRFLHLFVFAGARAFAFVLAVVLAGIGLGGGAGGLLLRRDPEAFRHAPACAAASGAATVLFYFSFAFAVSPFGTAWLSQPRDVLWLSAALCFPVALLSGLLFTLTGAALAREVEPETRAAGLLTMANTVGAGLGSLAAGFALLPLLGMERSLFGLSAAYGAVALLLLPVRGLLRGAPRSLPLAAWGTPLLAALALFPFGRMEERYLAIPARRFGVPERREVAAVREGRTETILYLRSSLGGEPVDYQLVTDGFGMASNNVFARRYMKLYVYWPLAFHPDARRALLISYGIGSTAKALTDSRGLERIDVVDISRDVLEASEIVYPDPAEHPLRDPRVRVHVEDGRYFVQASDERYDLITSEPPPPKHAGVVNLYTREYFELIRARLAEGGINSYWLPVQGLSVSDTRAILRAYCDAFADCSLWTGANLDWMLVGSRGGLARPSARDFSAQWRDPAVLPELTALGFEQPEQLGATFLADAETLREWTRGALPLVDDFPYLLGELSAGNGDLETYARWMDPGPARTRFRESRFIRDLWPAPLFEGTLAAFEYQRRINGTLDPRAPPTSLLQKIAGAHALLRGSALRTLTMWQLRVNHDDLRAVHAALARGAPEELHLLPLAMSALAQRDFERAAGLLARLEPRHEQPDAVFRIRLYALCMAQRAGEAEALVRERGAALPVDGEWGEYWSWMSATFGLAPPERLASARWP